MPKVLGVSEKSKIIKKDDPKIVITAEDVKRCSQSQVKNKDGAKISTLQSRIKTSDSELNCHCLEYFKPQCDSVQYIPTEIIDGLNENFGPEKVENDVLMKNFYAAINFTLGKHYYDVKHRLKMEFATDCVCNPQECSMNHKNICENLLDEVYDPYELVFRAVNYNQFDFVETIQMMSSEGLFPGSVLLRLLIDISLVVFNPVSNDKSVHAYDLITEAVTAFSQTLNLFPVCEYKVSYCEVLVGVPAIDSRFYHKSYAEDGFFKFVMTSLKKDIQINSKEATVSKYNTHLEDGSDDEEENDVKQNSSSNNNGDEVDSQELFVEINYLKWETDKEKQTFNFEEIGRSTRICRLFAVTKMALLLLEQDLAAFILRYSLNPFENIRNEEFRPILTKILWPHVNDTGKIIPLVQLIMTCFVDAVILDFPSSDIEILAQLLHLIALCIETSEIKNTSKDTINYPSFGYYSERFYKVLKIVVDEEANADINLMIKILNNVKTPFVQYKLSAFLINSIYKDSKFTDAPTSRQFYEQFCKKTWRKGDTEGQMQECAKSNEFNGIYPVKQKVRKARASQIISMTEKEYLTISLISFKAFLEIYQVREFIELVKTPVGSEVRKKFVESGCFTQPLDAKSVLILDDQVCYSKLAPPRPVFEKTVGKFVFSGINANSELYDFYKQQVKYCFYIGKMANEEYEKYPEVFSSWHHATQLLWINQYKEKSKKSS